MAVIAWLISPNNTVTGAFSNPVLSYNMDRWYTGVLDSDVLESRKKTIGEFGHRLWTVDIVMDARHKSGSFGTSRPLSCVLPTYYG